MKEKEEKFEIPNTICDLTLPIKPIELIKIIDTNDDINLPKDIELKEAYRLHLIARIIGAIM